MVDEVYYAVAVFYAAHVVPLVYYGFAAGSFFRQHGFAQHAAACIIEPFDDIAIAKVGSGGQVEVVISLKDSGRG